MEKNKEIKNNLEIIIFFFYRFRIVNNHFTVDTSRDNFLNISINWIVYFIFDM